MPVAKLPVAKGDGGFPKPRKTNPDKNKDKVKNG